MTITTKTTTEKEIEIKTPSFWRGKKSEINENNYLYLSEKSHLALYLSDDNKMTSSLFSDNKYLTSDFPEKYEEISETEFMEIYDAINEINNELISEFQTEEIPY